LDPNPTQHGKRMAELAEANVVRGQQRREVEVWSLAGPKHKPSDILRGIVELLLGGSLLVSVIWYYNSVQELTFGRIVYGLIGLSISLVLLLLAVLYLCRKRLL